MPIPLFSALRLGASKLILGAVVTVSALIIGGIIIFIPKGDGDSSTPPESPAAEPAAKPAPLPLATLDIYPGTRTWVLQEIGTSSTQISTITNSGTNPFVMTKITEDGGSGLTQTNDCPAIGSPLNPGQMCTVTMTFAPSDTGERTTVFSFYGNIADGRAVIVARGTGTTSTGLNTSPASLIFADDIPVGKSSTTQKLTVKNAAGSAIAISKISTTGDYSQTNTCPSSIAPGGTCTITVTFKPTDLGLRNGTVVITDNGSGSPHAISLLGEGKAADAPLAELAGSLDFETHTVGTSTTLSWKLENTGGGPLLIKKISKDGDSDFAQTNTCGSSVAADASCTITATFKPTSSGKKSGSVLIEHNAANGRTVLFLYGQADAIPAPDPTPAPEPTPAPTPEPGLIQFLRNDSSVHEGSGTATIEVVRLQGSDGTVTVDYTTGDGTATSDADYLTSDGTLTFGPGVTSRMISVRVLQDQDYEGNEGVNLILNNPTGGATLGDMQATLTIIDDTVSPNGIR